MADTVLTELKIHEFDSVEQMSQYESEIGDNDLVFTLDDFDYVVEFQAPTADNGYAWYRKYKSGWVEQGGSIDGTWSGTKTVTLPVPMLDARYSVAFGAGCPDINSMHGMNWITSKTSTQIKFTSRSLAGNFTTNNFSWQVSGMAA